MKMQKKIVSSFAMSHLRLKKHLLPLRGSTPVVVYCLVNGS